MKALQTAIIAMAIIFTSSCSKERLEGNGNIITEVRNLSNFSGIINSGSKNINVAYGAEYKVELRGSSNLIPAYRTEILNGNLNPNYDNKANVRDDDIEVYVTMPAIRSAKLTGSGDILIKGSFPARDYFEAIISGSGDIHFNGGFNVDELKVTNSGSGMVELLNVKSNRAEVFISASGNAKVNVTDQLKVRITGSGSTYYIGNPTIESDISGSGKVVKH
ncbi:MAG TPA: head GIN domain-containing protein [Pedobacter sp.]